MNLKEILEYLISRGPARYIALALILYFLYQFEVPLIGDSLSSEKVSENNFGMIIIVLNIALVFYWVFKLLKVDTVNKLSDEVDKQVVESQNKKDKSDKLEEGK